MTALFAVVAFSRRPRPLLPGVLGGRPFPFWLAPLGWFILAPAALAAGLGATMIALVFRPPKD